MPSGHYLPIQDPCNAVSTTSTQPHSLPLSKHTYVSTHLCAEPWQLQMWASHIQVTQLDPKAGEVACSINHDSSSMVCMCVSESILHVVCLPLPWWHGEKEQRERDADCSWSSLNCCRWHYSDSARPHSASCCLLPVPLQ
jgi:hypothetical protein